MTVKGGGPETYGRSHSFPHPHFTRLNYHSVLRPHASIRAYINYAHVGLYEEGGCDIEFARLNRGVRSEEISLLNWIDSSFVTVVHYIILGGTFGKQSENLLIFLICLARKWS